MVWLYFLLGTLVIILAGSRLSHYGDLIAERTGLGGAFIGIILLSTVTSLPEMAVSTTSTLIVGSPDLAVGGLLGSNTFNLAVIVLLDILYYHGPLLKRVHLSHILSAGLGVSFIGIVTALILFYQQGGTVQIFGVGIGSFIFVGMYLLSIQLIYRFERRRRQEVLELEAAQEIAPLNLRTIYLKTILAALAIITAGIWLSLTADEIAATTGWGESFVGSLFLAAATSLPEVVVSISALRLGALDMAVSNLLGSNLFNMVIVAVCDILYRPAPLLSAVSPGNIMAGLTAMVMTGIVITGLIYRTQSKSLGRVGWEAAALLATYLIGNYFLFVLSNR